MWLLRCKGKNIAPKCGQPFSFLFFFFEDTLKKKKSKEESPLWLIETTAHKKPK